MKSKAPLVLIELTVMLLVFALAAVFCLRAFVWADGESDRVVARDRAVLEAQNAGEVLKSCRGDGRAAAEIYGGTWDGRTWTICYDESWSQTDAQPRYLLRVALTGGELAYLGTAEVCVFRDETCLARLELAWQEVTPCA